MHRHKSEGSGIEVVSHRHDIKNLSIIVRALCSISSYNLLMPLSIDVKSIPSSNTLVFQCYAIFFDATQSRHGKALYCRSIVDLAIILSDPRLLPVPISSIVEALMTLKVRFSTFPSIARKARLGRGFPKRKPQVDPPTTSYQDMHCIIV
jgi:hypothetical protein